MVIFMEMFKDLIAVIGIALLILDVIIYFYTLIMDNDRKKKLKVVIMLIMQSIMLYGGYRMISYFNI